MFAKIKEIEERYDEFESQMASPGLSQDQNAYRKVAKEHSQLTPIITAFRKYQSIQNEIEDNKSLLNDPDPEIKNLAREEIDMLTSDLDRLEDKLKLLLLPKDPNDEKNILLEIRAGTGGDEAALFAADLFKMYCRYAELKGWKTEILSQSITGIGGFKEIIMLMEGKKVYSRLKYESGVHRVQRVPETETQGRIHTSAVTVAVLPEADEVDVTVDDRDLEIDVYRASGAGGQHVNTTDSAVRITHVPTGVVVTMQDERSQLQNRTRAMQVLRARLYELARRELEAEMSAERRSQVGGGGRSEKIRTYNYKENRVTDHRIGFTVYRLADVLAGDLDMVVDALLQDERTRQLADIEQ